MVLTQGEYLFSCGKNGNQVPPIFLKWDCYGFYLSCWRWPGSWSVGVWIELSIGRSYPGLRGMFFGQVFVIMEVSRGMEICIKA